MPGDPEPMAETSGAMVVAPARVPRAELRINDLPEDILRRVLSCLDAREAVQTCLLSKLWRDLWRDAPRINASSRAFEIDGVLDDHGRKLFKKFVSCLLMLRNPVPLQEFRLFCCVEDDAGRIYADSAEANLWIRHALLCEARSVESFIWEDRLDLNHAVFTSQHLTRLLLYSVVLTNGFFSQLQTGCKALERLILQECPITDIEIASQTLKFLSIGRHCWFEPYPNDPAHPPSLSLPNLIHLGFFGHRFYDIIPVVKNMESLQTAYVDLLHKFSNRPVGDIRGFLLGLSGVTKLEFCFGFGQEELMMGMDLRWCPKFNNLKFLSLGNWYLDENFYGLIAFLQKSPNLEHLTLNLNLKQHAKVPGALIGGPGNRSFTCEHLKAVEIIGPEDDPAVRSLREFLLGVGISDGQIHIKH